MPEAKRIKHAFITKVNNPKVKIFIGKVKIINIGFKITFITPKNKASQNAAQNPVTIMPGIIYALINIAAAEISHFKSKFIRGPRRTRTAYLCNANAALYQMSYRPIEPVLPALILFTQLTQYS